MIELKKKQIVEKKFTHKFEIKKYKIIKIKKQF